MTASDLSLRNATVADAPRLAANHFRAYPGGLGLAEREERFRVGRLFPPETICVAERAGELVGQARTMPFRAWFGGVESAAAGLAGVAVTPEARRTGVAKALIRDHLARCRALDAPWSILYPFSPRFYAAYGWAPSAQRARWRFAPAALPLYPERLQVTRLSLADTADRDAVQRAYARYCVATNGSLSRSDAWLGMDWSEDRHFVVGVRARPGGELDGYLFYQVNNPRPRPQVLIAPHLVAATPAALRALLGFLAAQTEQADEILLDLPPGQALGPLLDVSLTPREDPEAPGEHYPVATLYSGYMARVVDLPAALAARGYPAGRASTVAFQARDTLLPEAEAPVSLRVDAAGRPTVEHGRAAGAPLISGNIGPLSAVLVGALRLADAVALGRLEVEPQPHADLDALLSLPIPFCDIIF